MADGDRNLFLSQINCFASEDLLKLFEKNMTVVVSACYIMCFIDK